ncbi:hypothetical protein TY89_23580 [Paenibacillus polymyxa]|nr:hypothetical protein TY89_23580 [Paenibacillus polymyxa]
MLFFNRAHLQGQTANSHVKLGSLVRSEPGDDGTIATPDAIDCRYSVWHLFQGRLIRYRSVFEVFHNIIMLTKKPLAGLFTYISLDKQKQP